MTEQVVCEVTVDAPSSTVFRLLTEADLLVQWIGISATADPRPGGVFRFELFPGEFCSGRYVEVEKDRRVVFTWGWESGRMPPPAGTSTVTFVLTDEDGSTVVRVEHSGLDEIARAFHADGWPKFLSRLIAVAEGRDPGEDPAAPYADGRDPELPTKGDTT